MRRSCDVLVVGGGPAGAAAAIRGAAAGLSVVVCDKASFPRDKTCGDGLTTTALRRLTGVDGPHLGEWHAFRQYFTGVADRRLWVFFEPDLLPGYAWIFPVAGGRANVGFGLPRRPGMSVRPMAGQWRDLLDRPP